MMIAGQIATLLSHYWSTNEDPTLRKAQANDWLADLEEFPASVVAESCAMWRRQPGGKRPTPGDIRALCREVVPAKSPKPSDSPQIARVYHSPETVRDNWRSLPFPMLTDAERELFRANLPRNPLAGAVA